MNCLKRSSVGVAAGAVAQGAVAVGVVAAGAVVARAVVIGEVAAGAVAARADAAGPGATAAGAAGAEPGAEEPKSVSEAVKPLDSVDLVEPLGADSLDVAGADLLATPWVAAPCTKAQRREGAI